jgi:hypothetical protein
MTIGAQPSASIAVHAVLATSRSSIGERADRGSPSAP